MNKRLLLLLIIFHETQSYAEVQLEMAKRIIEACLRPSDLREGLGGSLEGENIAATIRLTLGRLRQFDASADELYQIFISPMNTAELQQQIHAWLQKHGSSFTAVWHHDIEALGNRYIAEGKINNRNVLYRYDESRVTDVDYNNISLGGFIDSQLWLYLLSQGKFPIADPHDVITHAPVLKDRTFAAYLQKVAAVR